MSQHQLSITPLGRIALSTNTVQLRRHRVILESIVAKQLSMHEVAHIVCNSRDVDIPSSTIAHDIVHLAKYNLLKVH